MRIRLAPILRLRLQPRTFLDFLGAVLLPLALPLSLVLGRRLTEPFIPITFAAFDETLRVSVSVCGGDIIAASSSKDGRRERVFGVADVLCDLDRDGGGGTPKSAPKPVEARVDFERDGVFVTLSEPDDLDITSLSLDFGTRADTDRLKLGFAGV